jgi:hypothetical protein
MAPSRRIALSIFIYVCIHIRQSLQQECWQDIPIKTENEAKCKECPKRADELADLFMERVAKRTQVKADLNCMADNTTDFAGTVSKYPWLCKQATGYCTERLEAYNWTNLADKAAKEAVINKADDEYKLINGEILRLRACEPKWLCVGASWSRSLSDSRREAQKMASALSCATDKDSGGIEVKGYKFKQPAGVSFLLKPCSKVANLYTGTNIKTEAFVKETNAKLKKLLRDVYQLSFCKSDFLCPCGDVELTAQISTLVKSVKCTDAKAENAGAKKLLDGLDKLLKDSDFSYTEKCADGKKPSDKPDAVRTTMKQLTEVLASWKLAKKLCPCLEKRKSAQGKIKKVIESYAQDATCANKALSDKTAAKAGMDEIKKVTDTLKITTDESKCPSATGSDADRNTKIKGLASRITELNKQLDHLAKCPCTDEMPGIDKNVIKNAKFEADCWVKKLKSPTDNVKKQKAKIDELIKKYRKDWETDKDGKGMENPSECRKDKSAVDEAAVLKKLTEIYNSLEALSKQGKMMKECPCKICDIEYQILLYNKMESLAKEATCKNKDLADKTPAKADMDAIKKVTDRRFMTVTEDGCPAKSGDDTARLSAIKNVAARIAVHDKQLTGVLKCPCKKVGDGCPCKINVIVSANQGYREVERLSNQAYCVDPKIDTTADASVKAAWAKIKPYYDKYFFKVSKDCKPDATTASASAADKVKMIEAIEAQLKELQPNIKTYEDAIATDNPTEKVFEKVYTKIQKKTELNCIAGELKKLTPPWAGTVSIFPWLCSSDTSGCANVLKKHKWSTLADNAAKTAVLTKLDGEYKVLINDLTLLSSCMAIRYACSSGKAELETRTSDQMQTEATKMASALKCTTDKANGGVTVAGYTFIQPVSVPVLKSCADAVKDYTGTNIMTEAFVKDTDTKLNALLKDFYEVSYCRRDGQCQCGTTESQIGIDDLVKSVKCTDAAKENNGAMKRMAELDKYLHHIDYKPIWKCAAGKKPSDKPNKINYVLHRIYKLIPIWKSLSILCLCQKEKTTGRADTKKVIETLAQEATCLNKDLTDKTAAKAKMDEITKITDGLQSSMKESLCITATTGSDAEKTAKITKFSDRIAALFNGYNNINSCPCELEHEIDAMKNYGRTQIRKTNCAQQNLAKPAEATEFKAAEAKIDAFAKKHGIEVDSSEKCEKVTTTDAALTAEVRNIATNLETIAKRVEVLKECPCKSSKELNDVKIYRKVQSLAQEAVCLNKELTDKTATKPKIDAIKAVTDTLLMTVTETGCTASTGDAAAKQKKITNIATRVSVHNTELDWVRKCPCKKSDKKELKLCGNKNAVLKELLEGYEDLAKLLQKANCIVPDVAAADATVKTAMAAITPYADEYFIKAGKTCPPGFTPPTVAADQVKALKAIEEKLMDLKFNIEFNEESLLAKDCTVSQFYQKYNRQTQLKSAMNCVALELKKLTQPWAGTISSNNWLCEKAAKDCTEWLAKYQFASKSDAAAKTAVLTTLETEYNKVLKQMKILKEYTPGHLCKRGSQYLEPKTATELYAELQKMQSALKCGTDKANGGVTVAGYTWAEISAIPFLITPCSKVVSAYTGTNIKTEAFVKETNTKLQEALKSYLEVYACRHDGACPCGNSELQAKLTAKIKAVKCTTASTTSALATSRLDELDEVLTKCTFSYAEKCADGEKPSIVADDIDDAIEFAKMILPKWQLLNDLCPCQNKKKTSVTKMTKIIESNAKTATCYNKELTDKTKAQANMVEIKKVTDSLGLTITEAGCTASTLDDAKLLAAITKLASTITKLNDQRTTVKKCPCNKLAGRKIRDVKYVLSRLKKNADCRKADLDTATDAGFKAKMDKIDALTKKYEIEACEKLECIPDTTSTDVQLTTKVTEIFTKMEKLAAILEEGKTCPCKLKASLRDLQLYNMIEALAQVATCNNKDLTNNATAKPKMDEITAVTDGLFMTITETGCKATTGDEKSRNAAIENAAKRITIHNIQLQNSLGCPCPDGDKKEDEKNECPCKLEKINSALDGYKTLRELLQKAKCIEPDAAPSDKQLAKAVDAMKQYADGYAVKVSSTCPANNTDDAKDKAKDIKKIEVEVKRLINKVKLLENCPCPAEAVTLMAASEKKLADYFYKAKCIGKKYKDDTDVSAALAEIDTIIAAQLVEYKTDCSGFTNPANDASNATAKIAEQKTLIEGEVTKLDKIDECRGLPDGKL